MVRHSVKMLPEARALPSEWRQEALTPRVRGPHPAIGMATGGPHPAIGMATLSRFTGEGKSDLFLTLACDSRLLFLTLACDSGRGSLRSSGVRASFRLGEGLLPLR